MITRQGMHMKDKTVRLMLLAGISCFGLPAVAHHSMAMFDRTTKVEITGTVADV